MAGVELWVAPLDPGPALRATLLASLAPAERDRAARFRSPDDRRRSAVARGWLRHILAEALGVAPAGVVFAGEPGKPQLAGRDGPCFNVSHAGELVAVAVADGAVGVDIEPVPGPPGTLDAARAACTPAEAEVLARLPAGDRPAAFLRMWTAKEAYLKATGQGLTTAPDHVETGAAWSGVPVAVGDRDSWWVRPVDIHPGYVGAVAARGRGWPVERRSPSSLGSLVRWTEAP